MQNVNPKLESIAKFEWLIIIFNLSDALMLSLAIGFR